MSYTKEETTLIWLDSFSGLEYKHKREIYAALQTEKDVIAAVNACRGYITENAGERVFETLINSFNRTYTDYILSGLSRKGVRAITRVSDGYPERLNVVPSPPFVLYVKGDETLLGEKTIGMVGSRKSLPVSVNIAKEFSETFAKAGFTPVTGIAEGVDSAVIRGALDGGGKVISVIAGGFDHVYPAANASLIDKITEKGLAVAEYPPYVKPDRFMFPVRNRIIAGLSDGVLVVSGAKKSGTLYTAEYAEEFGRDLFAVPYGVGIESGEGCNDLIKRGAMLCDTPDDILNFYGVEKKKTKIPLSAEETNVINVLRDGAKHIDEISRALGRESYEILTTLSVLEIKGVVAKNGVNVYGLIRNLTEV